MDDDEVFLRSMRSAAAAEKTAGGLKGKGGAKAPEKGAGDDDDDRVEEAAAAVAFTGDDLDDVNFDSRKKKKRKVAVESAEGPPAVRGLFTTSAPVVPVLPASLLSQLEYADAEVGKKRKREQDGSAFGRRGKHARFDMNASDETSGHGLGGRMPGGGSSVRIASSASDPTSGHFSAFDGGEAAAALKLKQDHFFGSRLKREGNKKGRFDRGSAASAPPSGATSVKEKTRTERQKLKHLGGKRGTTNGDKRSAAVLSAVMKGREKKPRQATQRNRRTK